MSSPATTIHQAAKSLKRFMLTAAFYAAVLLSVPLSAQVLERLSLDDYGNEWIKPAEEYFKLLVSADGIYRVSRAELNAAGVSTAGKNADNLHLYYRGEEVPLHMVKDGSGEVSWFLFYGRRNDGRFDSLLYKSPVTHTHDGSQQPTIWNSLFTDTSAYFTAFESTPGLRMNLCTASNYGDFTAETSFIHRYTNFYPERLGGGLEWTQIGGTSFDPIFNLNSDFGTGEGYTGYTFGAGGTTPPVTVPTPGQAGSGPVKVTARVLSTRMGTHIPELTVNGSPVLRDTFPSLRIVSFKDSATLSLPASSSVILRDGSPPTEGDLMFSCEFTLEYRRSFNLAGESNVRLFDFENSDTAYFVFSNVPLTTSAWLFDLTHGYIVPANIISGTTLQFLLPGAPGRRNLLMISDGVFASPEIRPQTSLRDLTHLYQDGGDILLIAHPSLRNSAESYRVYRDTATVNPARVIVAYVDEIYDEFGYGSISPLAIKNFCKYAIQNFTQPPQFVFLWGKGQERTRSAPFNLVPTFGFPPTDWEYVSSFDYRSREVRPVAAVGRLNARTDQEGLDYLTKLITYEHAPYDAWMKEGIMIGGGLSSDEENKIRSTLLNECKPWFEGPPNQGRASTFVRESGSLVSNREPGTDITDVINGGVSLLHYFGHSTNNIFDIDIKEPEQYTNTNKFPFMIAMGCYGGDFTDDVPSFGERFVGRKDKGAIGYLANSTAGVVPPLAAYATYFYPNAYGAYADEPIGISLRETARDMLTEPSSGTQTSNMSDINQVKQLNLQGDPSVLLSIPRKPDLAVESSGIRVLPGIVTARDSNFTIKIAIENRGRTFTDAFQYHIVHYLPNGTVNDLGTPYRGVFGYADTITVVIKNIWGPQLAGLNRIDVSLDVANKLDEYSESNNSATSEFLVQSEAPAAIYPPEFAVIPGDSVTLVASQFSISSASGVLYLFEIDTSHRFNSPLHVVSPAVSGTSALARWKVPFTLTPGQVYYWRVRLGEVLPPVWSYSSFRYIPGKTGWSQAKEPQMFSDGKENLVLSETELEWEFSTWSRFLRAFVSNDGGLNLPAYFMDEYGSDFPQRRDGITYTPISYNNLQPVFQDKVEGDWNFAAMPAGEGYLTSVIQSLAEGDYFLMCSNIDPAVYNWSDGMLHTLEQIGCDYTALRNITGSQPFVLLGQKGGSAQLILNPNILNFDSTYTWSLETNISSRRTSGKMVSTFVGPSTSWSELDWSWYSLDQTPQESDSVDVYGVRADYSTALLYSGLQEGLFSLSGTDATEFPRLQLISRVRDEAEYTPPVLDHWTVYHTLTPDAAVDPSSHFAFQSDVIRQGETLTASLAVRNISQDDMDSMLVRFSIEQGEATSIVLGTRRFAPLAAGDTNLVSIVFNTSTLGISGNVQFVVEINPDNDQPEMHRFNNFFRHPFRIERDGRAPSMEVVVDGKHLTEGDIVSPQPEITIRVKDESALFAHTVSDSTYKIWFGKGRLEEEVLPVIIEGNEDIEAIPGSLPENKSRLVFRPGPLEDGEYTLRAQAYDNSGNPAGREEYEIHFNVVTENSITKVLPYPNPFSSGARWAYLLTGTEMPYRFEIEIYTVAGKMVKRLNLLESEPVYYGYNITQTAWDGRDEFGDPVANGVYIYKVIVKFKDRTVEVKDAAAGKYFSESFGKIYLMR